MSKISVTLAVTPLLGMQRENISHREVDPRLEKPTRFDQMMSEMGIVAI
jgi:hypothetical protein